MLDHELNLFFCRATVPGDGLLHRGRGIFYHFDPLFRSREHSASARLADPFDGADILGKKKRFESDHIGLVALDSFLEGFKNMEKAFSDGVFCGRADRAADH